MSPIMSSNRPDKATHSPPPGSAVVALIQMTGHASKAPNVDKALARIAEAAAAGANVICLQELFAGQYPCQSEDHARFDRGRADPRPDQRALAAAARRAWRGRSSARCSSAARPGLYHNTAVVFDADGSTAGMYRKMHIPDDPLYYEKFYFTPGDLGFQSFDTQFGRVGVLRLLGSVVSRGRPADGAAPGPRSCSIPPPSAGFPTRRQEYGASQHSPGRR